MEEQLNTIEVSEETETIAGACLENNYEKAQAILNDEDKLEELLQKAEKKLKSAKIPKITIKRLGITINPSDLLSYIVLMISMIRMYVKKKYTAIPIGTIIAVVAAVIYLVSPIDLIPDPVPVAGLIDDAIVITFCVCMVKSDLDEYTKWKEENGL